jgi:hypothetical protein
MHLVLVVRSPSTGVVNSRPFITSPAPEANIQPKLYRHSSDPFDVACTFGRAGCLALRLRFGLPFSLRFH